MKSPYQRPMVANLTSKPRSPWILKPTPIAYFYEFLCRAEGRARAIPVVRDLGVHLSGLCDQHGWPDRRAGVVLPSAGHRGEPDQGSQQRCGVGCASLQALGHELRSLPTGHAGLQPELLVVAVQSGKDGRRNRDETYATVDGAIAFSVSGGQDLVPCRPSGHQLQRSLPGERNLSTADGSLAAHHRWRQRIRTCRTHRSSLLTKHHAWFFMHSKRRSSNNLQDRENADRDHQAETKKRSWQPKLTATVRLICVHKLGDIKTLSLLLN